MRFRHFLFALLLLPAACVSAPEPQIVQPKPEQAEPSTLNGYIAHFAAFYDVPESLVHRVVKRESTYNPKARNGPYYGLMQILPQTARTMGFRGKPSELLDAKTNLRYGVKYLRGAWLLSDGSHDQAVKWYSRGYYYEAKRRGMLVETGLRPG